MSVEVAFTSSVWLAGLVAASQAGYVVYPLWNWLDVALITTALGFVVMNFYTEVLGHAPLPYSKFSLGHGSLDARLAFFLCYFAPALLYVWLWERFSRATDNYHATFLFALVMHYTKRCLECLFVHNYSAAIRFTDVVSIGGRYSLASASAFLVVNFMTAPSESYSLPNTWPLVIFVIGQGLNFWHHVLQASLRTHGSREYFMPTRGLFAWAACPHYLGELISWFGIAMLGRAFVLYMMVLTMVVYLTGRAVQTRRWYRERMPESVPENWYAILPGLA